MQEPWIVRQRIDIPYRYTTGPALDRFFRGLREGVLWASRCDECHRTSFPPISFCGNCWKPVTTYLQISGKGTVVSFTRIDQLPPELEGAAQPLYYGLLALEEADSRFVHLVRPAPGSSLAVGASVEAVWREQRTGTIRDLDCFQATFRPTSD
jgi:uncharacterized OB-fold protein